jgi:hypothetical protein
LGRDLKKLKTICLALDGDHQLDIRAGSIIRLAPVVDEDGALFAFWIIDDRSGEPLDLVSAESVRITRE